MTRRKYFTLKYNKKFQTVQVKTEKDSEDEMVSKINQYIEEHTTHFYTTNEIDMVELHADVVCSYTNNKSNLPPLGDLGGSISVRLPEGTKPWLVFGQDEVIFRSSQLNENCWTVDGESTLRTKGQGTGLIVSAFVSRAFGLGLKIGEEQLAEINKTREGNLYKDKEAATYLFGRKTKNPLTESPFVRYLNHGAEKEGY